MELAAFHDDGQVGAVCSQHRDIFKRVAIDQQDVGETAFRDFANVSFRVQDYRVVAGNLLQDLEVAEDF